MAVLAVAAAVEVDETDEGRFIERNSLPRRNFVQRVVDVRQMIRGNITDKGADDFVICACGDEASAGTGRIGTTPEIAAAK